MTWSRLLKVALMLSVLGASCWVLYHRSNEGGESEQSVPLFPALKVADITGVTAQFIGGSYDLVRIYTKLSPEERIIAGSDEGERWVAAFPPGAPIRQDAVSEILQSTLALSADRQFTEVEAKGSDIAGLEASGSSPSTNAHSTKEGASSGMTGDVVTNDIDFGIVPPLLEFTMRKGDVPIALSWGFKNPISGRRYLQVSGNENPSTEKLSGEKISLGDDSVYLKQRVTAFDLRLKELLGTISPARVKTFSVHQRRVEERLFERVDVPDLTVETGQHLGQHSGQHSGKRWQLTLKNVDTDGAERVLWIRQCRDGLVDELIEKLAKVKVVKFLDELTDTESASFTNPIFIVRMTLAPENEKQKEISFAFAVAGLPADSRNIPAESGDKDLASAREKYRLFRFQHSIWAYTVDRSSFQGILRQPEDFVE